MYVMNCRQIAELQFESYSSPPSPLYSIPLYYQSSIMGWGNNWKLVTAAIKAAEPVYQKRQFSYLTVIQNI